MWYLFKGSVWFSAVLVLLPFIDADSAARLENAPAVEIGDTLAAASEAIHYVTAMCVEKPDVCEKGAETFVALGHRAREGARFAYLVLDKQFADDRPRPEAAADRIVTGTIAIPTPRPDPRG